MRRANCASLPPDVFFSDDEEDQASAKTICSRCEVIADCLIYAFNHESTMQHGIYGMTTPAERNAYQGERPKAQSLTSEIKELHATWWALQEVNDGDI